LGAKFGTTLQEIQDHFIQAIRPAVRDPIDFSADRMYFDDQTDPPLSHPLQPVPDLSILATSLNSRHFDLVLASCQSLPMNETRTNKFCRR
jgi:hypothetical protein